MSPLLGGVVAFVVSMTAEFVHDRLAIEYNQLTSRKVPPWTRRSAMKRRVRKALWKTLWLCGLQWVDMVGIFKFHLPILAIAAGSTAGSLLATRATMWGDWQAGVDRYRTFRTKARLTGGETSPPDPHQLPLDPPEGS